MPIPHDSKTSLLREGKHKNGALGHFNKRLAKRRSRGRYA